MSFTFIDLFAGIGGIRIGFERNDFTCVFSSEKDEQAQKTYFENFKEMPFGDITLLNEDDILRLPDFDVLTAGFPCQPFSISGKQLGFQDSTRGTLFFNILEISRLKQPKVLFLENVANLYHHDGGTTFSVIIKSLEELGYSVSYQILDSSKFGVPQHRKRTYIVAVKSDIPFVFPSPLGMKSSLKDILELDIEHIYLPENTYTLIENPNISPNGMLFVGYMNKNPRKKGVREDSLHLSRTHKQINRIYSSEYIHPTLTASEKSGRYYILDENGVRKLTLNECYRLQGFPDDFIRVCSPSHQYQQIGNSVTIPVIQSIAHSIKEFLSTY